MSFREPKSMFVRRLRMAWWFRCWPWSIPENAVKYIALDQRLTPAEIKRGQELAAKYGWESKER